PKVTIMIGPEGDFSRAEVALALERGWQPVSLGDSRLRIETAAIVATAAVYLHFSHL
ncbi:MAG: RsmE family RNA methyltransferase, partial [Bacteroidales bacterium]|nr:RsmE family RNA methyltransferase [Bacteroidales bacterium]